MIWNFLHRLVTVPEHFCPFKQRLRKRSRDINTFSFNKGVSLIATKKSLCLFLINNITTLIDFTCIKYLDLSKYIIVCIFQLLVVGPHQPFGYPF